MVVLPALARPLATDEGAGILQNGTLILRTLTEETQDSTTRGLGMTMLAFEGIVGVDAG